MPHSMIHTLKLWSCERQDAGSESRSLAEVAWWDTPESSPPLTLKILPPCPAMSSVTGFFDLDLGRTDKIDEGT